MTENEALEILNNECEDISKVQIALKVAREALEEIQQYRAIGTVDEVAEMENSYINYFHKARQYEAIGTVEEFKALKEKSVAKKPDYEGDGYYSGELVLDTWICPKCGKSYEVDYDDYDFCPNCGQHIDHSGLTEDD